jgi:hypothetical protein
MLRDRRLIIRIKTGLMLTVFLACLQAVLKIFLAVKANMPGYLLVFGASSLVAVAK